MKRDIEQHLQSWKNKSARKPLLLRGARQVGKTFAVQQFGREQFKYLAAINFERDPVFKSLFTDLNPQRILIELESRLKIPILPGETLLFFDEIQECPQAIMSLRYFKEECPDLHVIGAGSLLEFALNDPNFKMPVGRVEFLYLKPMSFREFLEATGFHRLKERIASATLANPLTDAMHEQALDLVKDYMDIGGLPDVILEYTKNQNRLRCQEIQSSLLATYQNDFGKYSSGTNHKYLQLLFQRVPYFIAQWFKYVKISPDIHPRAIRDAIDRLSEAGLIYEVLASTASGLPLIALANTKKFKLLFLDIGLLRRASSVDISFAQESDLMLVNQGAFVEQLVGQELLAYGKSDEEQRLFAWVREVSGSSAEVDFITTHHNQIVPVEVKAGATGRLKSLKIFLEEKGLTCGVRVSQVPLSWNSPILSVPLYMVGEVNRLVLDNSNKNSNK